MILRIVPIRRKIGAPPRAAPFGVVPPKRSGSAARAPGGRNAGKMLGKWWENAGKMVSMDWFRGKFSPETPYDLHGKNTMVSCKFSLN